MKISKKKTHTWRYHHFMQASGVTLLFEHSPSWVSEIERFEIFSYPQENKLTR